MRQPTHQGAMKATNFDISNISPTARQDSKAVVDFTELTRRHR